MIVRLGLWKTRTETRVEKSCVSFTINCCGWITLYCYYSCCCCSTMQKWPASLTDRMGIECGLAKHGHIHSGMNFSSWDLHEKSRHTTNDSQIWNLYSVCWTIIIQGTLTRPTIHWIPPTTTTLPLSLLTSMATNESAESIWHLSSLIYFCAIIKRIMYLLCIDKDTGGNVGHLHKSVEDECDDKWIECAAPKQSPLAPPSLSTHPPSTETTSNWIRKRFMATTTL